MGRGDGVPSFLFKLGGAAGPVNITASTPHVRLMGDVAVISFIRLCRSSTRAESGNRRSEETRVWQQQNGRWRHVHFHRSAG